METATANVFEQPTHVSDIDMAFPANVSKLLPAMKDIPDEFKRSGNKWCRVVSHWFFCGLPNAKWQPKAGINQNTALRHVQTCLGSFAPQHEHKEAGCAYLLSLWFEDVTYDDK
jgi:hypothetical protein